MGRLDLLAAVVSGLLLLMIVLQSFLNRAVWSPYVVGLAAVLVAWVLLSPWPLSVVQ